MKKWWSNVKNRVFGGLDSKSAGRAADDPKRYRITKQIGQGSFGSVYKAKDRNNNNVVAIKKIRAATSIEATAAEMELSFNMAVSHQNVIRLLGHFREKRKEKRKKDPPVEYICLVMEYSKDTLTLKGWIDDFKKKGKILPNQTIQLLTFQIFRALHYLHSLNIVHRDVKPSNFLINKQTYVLKICDFGSAMMLTPGEPRDTGACSVPYRAPELELHNEDYTEKIDLWSSGCVIAECYAGEILFREIRNRQHYDQIRTLMGDPTLDDLKELQPILKDPPPPLYPSTFDQHFNRLKSPTPEAALTFIKKLLSYKPSSRPSAMEAMADRYYSDLRQVVAFDNMLYDFTESELTNVSPDLLMRVVPDRYHNAAVLQKIGERLPSLTAISIGRSTREPPKNQNSKEPVAVGVNKK